jgi:hypothetical protein
LRAVGDFGGMSDHDDGATVAVKVLEQGQDLVAGPAIQRASRLVGQNQSRIIHHRARNDDALLLTSGELIRPMMAPVAEADPIERPFGSASPFLATSARVNKGQFDIFQRAGPRQKRRNLKDETDILAPDGRADVFVQLYNFSPVQRIFAAVRTLQKASPVSFTTIRSCAVIPGNSNRSGFGAEMIAVYVTTFCTTSGDLRI